MHAAQIPRQGFFATMLGCGKDAKYRKMLRKADASVARELDLVKFIQRQRLLTFATLSTFNGRQKFIADKMATHLIRESSDMNDRSEDNFELDIEHVRDIDRYTQKIFQSKRKVDRRLI